MCRYLKINSNRAFFIHETFGKNLKMFVVIGHNKKVEVYMHLNNNEFSEQKV